MPSGHLSNEEVIGPDLEVRMISALTTHDERQFFVQLEQLFETRRQKDHGSVFLTQKRLTHGVADDDSAGASVDPRPSSVLPLLVRATDGRSKVHRAEKIKLSTIVEPAELDGFFTRYAELCRGGMQALKKRDRSGRKKAKGKKKKGATA